MGGGGWGERAGLIFSSRSMLDIILRLFLLLFSQIEFSRFLCVYYYQDMNVCFVHLVSLTIITRFMIALLKRKFHISQISHHAKNWYQNVTFGNG